ncbi:hypothetical protein [Streptomyces sp. NPDC097619]|uniref:hypothetical protein n=1 Tax=Streptomyces sp. NPDC097619 TaxID=3157228 RepID=UPI003319888F
MPRLTRRQHRQLDDIEHFARKVLGQLSAAGTVVTMRSHGTTTAEFFNERSGEWVTPVRPASLAYVEHILQRLADLRSESEQKGAVL